MEGVRQIGKFIAVRVIMMYIDRNEESEYEITNHYDTRTDLSI